MTKPTLTTPTPTPTTYKTILTHLTAWLVLTLVAAAWAQDVPNLFVAVSTDDTQTQMMAMVLANQALEQGSEVRVLLCSESGNLAVASETSPSFAPRDVTPKQLLQALLEADVTVEVCAIFLPNSDYDESDLLPGVGVAAPSDIAAAMLEPDTRLFTF